MRRVKNPAAEVADASHRAAKRCDNLPGARESLRVDATVVRSEGEEETGCYLAGATFLAPDEATR